MSFFVVRPSHTVLALLYFGSMIILPVILLRNGLLGYGFIFFVLWFAAFFGMVHHCLFRKIIVSAYGIKYKTLFKSYEMTWQEIKRIGLGYIPFKTPGRKPWIYFSDVPVSMPMLTARSINKKFFMISYRQKIIDEVRKYWDYGIDGLDFT
jgi:hypothetical protein